ncbi:MAG: ParB N-terminal domain-containing protein [Atopobiaceae bacterium]|nr:ParB N-terminal domain-containing protein [Atopobiaceae bacterium]
MESIKVYGDGGKPPVIHKTSDYSVFRRMEGNREVTARRAKNIRKSIEEIGLVPAPIVVNERMEVIDGQGRLEAIKQLGLPAFFIIVKGLGLDECVAMNVNSTPWTVKDYIESYAEIGKPDYVRLKMLMDSYDLPINVVICAATGLMATVSANVTKGKIKLDEQFYWDVDKMLAYVERFVKVMKANHISNRSPVLSALCFCYQCEDVDNERMFNAFERHCHKLNSGSKITEVLDVLTEIYNFGRRNNRVYITTKYHEYLDGKYPWYGQKWYRKGGDAE